MTDNTDKKFPIQNKWIYKSVILAPIYLLAVWSSIMNPDDAGTGSASAGSLFIWALVFTIVLYGATLLALIIRLHQFHYELGDQYLHLQQGFFSKQQRNIPYGTIQNVIVKRDLLDRVFGLASLSIENAAAGGRNTSSRSSSWWGGQAGQAFGFQGNRVSIPGLNVADAEALKIIVLNEVKAHPTDIQSGL